MNNYVDFHPQQYGWGQEQELAMNVGQINVGGYDVFCRKPTPGCDSYTNKPMSYQGTMLRSDFARFGLGLETILKSHMDHTAIDSVMGALSTDLRGKYRLMEVIMRNAGDQNNWQTLLNIIADQIATIGTKLGPDGIKPDGLALDYDILGDLFAQFIDQHKVQFAYGTVQTKFKVWKADISSTFQTVDDVLSAHEKLLADPNFKHLSGLHKELTGSIKKALASPILMMNLEDDHSHKKTEEDLLNLDFGINSMIMRKINNANNKRFLI